MTGPRGQKVELVSSKISLCALEVNLTQRTRFMQLIDGPITLRIKGTVVVLALYI